MFTGSTDWRPARLGVRDLVALVCLIGVVGAAALWVALARRNFGPLDELQHFNYLMDLLTAHRIPLPGDVLTQEALHARACRPITTEIVPACSSHAYDPGQFPLKGLATAGGYPPAYYIPTAIVAWVVHSVLGVSDYLIAARVAAIGWLLSGTAMTYWLGRSFCSRPWLAALVAGVVAFDPMIMYQGSHVSPDGAALLAGASVALAWMWVRGGTGPRGPWILFGVLWFVCWIKPNFIVVAIAVGVAEILLAVLTGGARPFVRRDWRTALPRVRRVVPAALGAVVLGVSWSAVTHFLGRDTSTILTPEESTWGQIPFSVGAAFRYWRESLLPFASFPRVNSLNSLPWHVWANVVNVLLVSGLVLAVVAVRWLRSRAARVPDSDGPDVRAGVEPVVLGEDPLRAVGVLGLAMLVLAAPVAYVLVAASGTFIGYPPRYSMFVAPIGVACVVGLLEVWRPRSRAT